MYTNINGVWKGGTDYVNIDGVWRTGLSYININGVWKGSTAFFYFLYKQGQYLNTDVTGGFSSDHMNIKRGDGYSRAYASDRDSYIRIRPDHAEEIRHCTKNKILVRGYKYLCFDIEFIKPILDNHWVNIELAESTSTTTFKSTPFPKGASGNQIYKIDVSNVNGNYYVGVSANTGNRLIADDVIDFKITNIYFTG